MHDLPAAPARTQATTFHSLTEYYYYGGGAGLLLTAWLGWYYREVGQLTAARSCQRWIEQRTLPCGEMPEQVAEHLHAPGKLAEWEERWGRSACPLLWSHVMYFVLQAEVE